MATTGPKKEFPLHTWPICRYYYRINRSWLVVVLFGAHAPFRDNYRPSLYTYKVDISIIILLTTQNLIFHHHIYSLFRTTGKTNFLFLQVHRQHSTICYNMNKGSDKVFLLIFYRALPCILFL